MSLINLPGLPRILNRMLFGHIALGIFGGSIGGAIKKAGGAAAGMFGGVYGGALGGGGGLYGILKGKDEGRGRINEIMTQMGKDPFKYNSFLQDGMLPEELTSQDILNREGLEKLRGLTLSDEETPWAALARQQQAVEEEAAFDLSQRHQLGQLAGAKSGLAMRGGLRSGAAERLAGSGQRNLLGAQQDVRRQGMLSRAGIGAQDAATKIGMLQALPGLETGAAQYGTGVEQFNLGNIMQERAREEQARLIAWQEKQKLAAAQIQAEAMLSQEPKGLLGGGGILGTGVGGSKGVLGGLSF